MRASGWCWRRPSPPAEPPSRPGASTPGHQRRRGRRHRRGRRDQQLPALRRCPRRRPARSRRRSARRSTTRSCTASRRPAAILREGDLLSIDAGCILDGWHSDSAVSVHVGDRPPSMEEVDLITACERAMWAGIAAAGPHGRLGDVSWAIEQLRRRSAAPGRPALRVGRRIRRARHRHRHAHGAVRGQPGQAGQGPAAGARHGAGHRADDHPRPAGDRASCPTAGPWSPGTAPAPRTSSTPSPSPRTASAC